MIGGVNGESKDRRLYCISWESVVRGEVWTDIESNLCSASVALSGSGGGEHESVLE